LNCKIKHVKFLKGLNEMKKVFLFFAVAAIFASCGPKATEETTVAEDSAVVVEEVVVDSVATDSVADTTVVAQ
jgi:hypothetical protein